MSRIGRQPVPIPQGVDVKVDTEKVFVKGPLGALTRPIPPDITVSVAQSNVVVQRAADTRQHRALHGLVRNEIRNMIEGVTKGYERVLEITGVG
jgi:large subunit ribosomal protein L6